MKDKINKLQPGQNSNKLVTFKNGQQMIINVLAVSVDGLVKYMTPVGFAKYRGDKYQFDYILSLPVDNFLIDEKHIDDFIDIQNTAGT